ncbi:MAG: hypothetical protein M3403_03720 [Gemmatimonadota bacterium]|nr:hypothetical protein [Gemmatimonadota bacterium]
MSRERLYSTAIKRFHVYLEPERERHHRRYTRGGDAGRKADGIGPESFVPEGFEAEGLAACTRVTILACNPDSLIRGAI